MSDIIKVKDSNYSYYEDLILRRDKLNKEAFEYQREYVRVFGALILKVFEKKIECIRKKKTIAYLQAAINHGESVDQNALDAYLKAEMEAFQRQLDEMVKDHDAAQNSKQVTEVSLLKIRKIYHKLAKLIHPDLNPETAKNKTLQDLWNRIGIAYNCNNLKDLEELEVLVLKALDELGTGSGEIDIPDIERKIKEIETEIEKIRSTDPYQYKYILEDRKEVEIKNSALNEELSSYEEYSFQLEEVLTNLSKGVRYKWQMN